MTKLTQKRITLFGGLTLLLAAVGCYLLWNFRFSSNRVSSRSAPQQQNAEPPSDQRTRESMARGSLPGGQFAGSESGEAAGLLEGWLNSNGKNDGSGTPVSIQEVIQSLRTNPKGNATFYQRVRQILEDQSIDAVRKRELIFALDRAATPAAFQLLVELSQLSLPAMLKEAVLSAIAHVGDYYWDKQSLAQVAPGLQQLWLQSEDPELLRSVAAAMAKVGDTVSINALMDAVLSNSKSLADIEHSNDARISAAWTALQLLHKPEVVPTLESILRSDVSTLEASVSASLLAGMGNTGNMEARRALLSWAEGTGDQYAPIVRDAFSKFGTYDSRQYFNSALAQNPAFRSSLVKAAILSALKP